MLQRDGDLQMRYPPKISSASGCVRAYITALAQSVRVCHRYICMPFLAAASASLALVKDTLTLFGDKNNGRDGTRLVDLYQTTSHVARLAERTPAC